MSLILSFGIFPSSCCFMNMIDVTRSLVELEFAVTFL